MSKFKTHLHPPRDQVRWDWWSENPVELVIVLLILVAFFFFPKEGCGISEIPQEQDVAPAVTVPGEN